MAFAATFHDTLAHGRSFLAIFLFPQKITHELARRRVEPVIAAVSINELSEFVRERKVDRAAHE